MITDSQMAAFKVYLEQAFNKDISIEFLLDQFGDYNAEVLMKAVKDFCKQESFYNIAKLHNYYKAHNLTLKHNILQMMDEDGYFENLYKDMWERDINKCPNNLRWLIQKAKDKANVWLDSGVIPDWFREDMKKYYIDNKEMLSSTKQLQLG